MTEPSNEQRLTAFIFMMVLAAMFMGCVGLGFAFIAWLIVQ